MSPLITGTCVFSKYTLNRILSIAGGKNPALAGFSKRNFHWFIHTTENSGGISWLSVIKLFSLKAKQEFGYQKIDEWILGSQHAHNNKYSRNGLE